MKALNMKAFVSVVLVFMLAITAACSSTNTGRGSDTTGSESNKPEKIVELKSITMGTEPQTGMDEFYKQLDELTVKDLGAKIRFDFIPWGDEKNQISRAIVAKEYDLYVGGGWSDYPSFAQKNAFADLKPLLGEVPELVKHYNGALERVELGGKLFGIPQFGKPGAGGEGVLYREDLRKEWNLPEIKDFASLEQYLYKAKEEFPDTPMINDPRVGYRIFQMIAGGKYIFNPLTQMQGTAFTVSTLDNPYKAINVYETPEFKEAVTIAQKWYKDGIIAHDILAAQGNETDKTKQLMLAGQKPLEFSNHFWAVSGAYVPAIKVEHPDYEFGWLDFTLDMAPANVWMPQLTLDTTAISVGAHSKYPEIALKFIEKAHTDRTYYDLLQYGVSGIHYNFVDGVVNYDGIADKNRRPGWTGLNDGFMNYKSKYPGEWQAYADKMEQEGAPLAEKNGVYPYEGFFFNTSGLSAELSSLETARTQYIQPWSAGVIKKSIDEDLEAAMKQLKAAGLDKYMEELQKQLDEFAAAKK
ncbi:DUF3502 domain-containing protein [Paenibacillus tarimensis]